jgi:8-hydroxy-5-deazaflavin:NADPH oxidoreductase
MKIGIIGAGHIGGTLARRLTAVGHEVFIANSRGPETLADLARDTDAKAVTVKEAARAGKVVVITIPLKNIPKLPRDLFAGVGDDVVVIDTGNYYPQRDGRIDAIESGTAESRWTSQQLGRPTVKAFNNIYAQHLLELGRPKGAENRIALPVAGDRKADKDIVFRLLDELGFDAFDAGGLDDSWRQQPGTPVYGTDLGAEDLRKALAKTSRERPAQFRAPAAGAARDAGSSSSSSRA